MIAGKGFERSGPPEFNETDCDGGLLFMKAYSGKFGANDALEQDFPTTLVDEDGEERDRFTRPQER
jgi:hypothetical protein